MKRGHTYKLPCDRLKLARYRTPAQADEVRRMCTCPSYYDKESAPLVDFCPSHSRVQEPRMTFPCAWCGSWHLVTKEQQSKLKVNPGVKP